MQQPETRDGADNGGADNGGAHEILWANVQSMREVLLAFAAQAAERGDEQGRQARLFIERKIAEVPRGASIDDLWTDLELLFRKTTALVAETLVSEQRQAGMAFIGSAGMLLGLLKPDLPADQREAQLMASIDRRIDELSAA